MDAVAPDAAAGEEAGAPWQCVACGGPAAPRRIQKQGFEYAVCHACGTASLDPLPEARDAAALYGDDYFVGGANGGYPDYVADESLHRRNARIRLRAIERRGLATGRMLDVGCASGFFLSEARKRGWEVVGVDVSPWAAREARTRFELQVCSDLASIEPGSVDLVCMSQVLEHAPDPLDLLRKARACLGAQGGLFVETWDRGSLAARLFAGHWQQITPPSVVHLFTRAGISKLLERSAFASPSFARATKFVSAGFVAGLLGQKYQGIHNAVERGPAAGFLARVPLPYFFGDLIHVTASCR